MKETQILYEQYCKVGEKVMIKVYATLSQLNYSFNELKAVSLTGI